jgi:hypothetical protein
MIFPRSAELRWQQEVIERWLVTSSIPPDAREGLLELLKLVNQEMENLETAPAAIDTFRMTSATGGLRR